MVPAQRRTGTIAPPHLIHQLHV
ncbi:hypothetical protein FAGKG844_100019 [Frankia sp. AgKG'84/4]